MALGFFGFLDKIRQDLYQSVYLALGGSIEDQTFDWAKRGLHFAEIGIKILVLLVFIGFWYWVLVYVLKHMRQFLKLSKKQVRITRSVLRYLWLVLSLIAIMSQVGFSGDTIKAFAKASVWAGFFYVLLSFNNQMVHWLLGQYEVNESIEQLVRNLMLVLILVFASGTILAQFGFDIVSLVAGLGIVGLAVGFAAQSTLANFIAGITILVEQSFQVGDWIAVNQKEGRVVKITLRTTHILDRDNIVVIFPNSTVASSEVINLTSKTFIRFDVPVRIGLNEDVDKARTIILATLKTNEVVLKHPLSTVTVEKVGEYDLHLLVRFWLSPTAVARLPIVKETIIEQIKKALDSKGIKTPYPYSKVAIDKSTQETQLILDAHLNKKDG